MGASKLEYLGIQDTPRKRRLDNGPWTGGLFDTKEDKITKTKTVTQEKWIKAKGYTQDLVKELETDHHIKLSSKRLERIRGFLNGIWVWFMILSFLF